MYTQLHCDGRSEASNEQPMAPHAPTHHPSYTRDFQRHKPCSATKIKVAASFTMLDERSITTYATAASGEVNVGESTATKLI